MSGYLRNQRRKGYPRRQAQTPVLLGGQVRVLPAGATPTARQIAQAPLLRGIRDVRLTEATS